MDDRHTAQALPCAAIAGLASEPLLAELGWKRSPRTHVRQALVARGVRLAAQ